MTDKNFYHTNCPIWFNIYLKNQKYLKKNKLKRIGQCTHCGDCCKTVLLTVNWGKEFYRLKGLKGEFCGEYDIADCRCSHYMFRPLLCRMFPMRPSDLKWLPNCTYKFVKSKK